MSRKRLRGFEAQLVSPDRSVAKPDTMRRHGLMSVTDAILSHCFGFMGVRSAMRMGRACRHLYHVSNLKTSLGSHLFLHGNCIADRQFLCTWINWQGRERYIARWRTRATKITVYNIDAFARTDTLQKLGLDTKDEATRKKEWPLAQEWCLVNKNLCGTVGQDLIRCATSIRVERNFEMTNLRLFGRTLTQLHLKNCTLHKEQIVDLVCSCPHVIDFAANMCIDGLWCMDAWAERLVCVDFGVHATPMKIEDDMKQLCIKLKDVGSTFVACTQLYINTFPWILGASFACGIPHLQMLEIGIYGKDTPIGWSSSLSGYRMASTRMNTLIIPRLDLAYMAAVHAIADIIGLSIAHLKTLVLKDVYHSETQPLPSLCETLILFTGLQRVYVQSSYIQPLAAVISSTLKRDVDVANVAYKCNWA